MAFLPKTASLSPKAIQTASSQALSDIERDRVSEENLRERRYLWTARAFAMVFIVSFITNIMMLMALFSLVPLVRVQPYKLVFTDKNAQTVTVSPLKADANTMKEISSDMVRQYVIARETISADPEEMAFRWGPDGIINLLSTDNVFLKFSQTANDVLQKAVGTQERRSVHINSAMPYGSGPEGEYWLVNYNLIKMSPQRTTQEITPRVATLIIGYEPYKTIWENRLKNPVGFKVRAYGSETKAEFDAREGGRQ